MLDLNDVNSVNDIPNVQRVENQIIDRDESISDKSIIENQYIELDNLGINLLKEIDDKDLKSEVLDELLQFANDNFISIAYMDQVNISRAKLNEIGELVYQFLCVDCYNTLIPNFLSTHDIYNIKQFDIYFKNNLKNDVSTFKASFAKTINSVINKLFNLSNIDKKIKADKTYNEILKKYGFYLELINYGDSDKFLFNYFRPVLSKHESDLTWRM